ncbi:MAG: hydroxyacid dehydrogenase [Alphaproteobacteria bacterium]|nr:hydroxyacid dehydrogenase [Alphaproteobacteria bacterium]
MARIAVLDDYQRVSQEMADWSRVSSQAEVVVFDDHLSETSDLIERLKGFNIVCAMRERTPFPRPLIEQLPDLKLLITTGPRNASIDVAAANENGIVVCHTASLPTGTPELTWTLILALARKIPEETENMREGRWQTSIGNDLSGKTLGILGLGRLGSRVARVANAFDMSVIAWSQNLTDERAAECGATRVSKNDLFAQSDFVTVHLVLSDRTRGLIGADELDRMKSSAFLVNTSRGPIVQEPALIHAIENNVIAGVGLDVYDTEPLPSEHPYRRLPNVVLTPHIGYVTEESYRTFYGGIVEDLEAWLAGDPIRILNP